MVFDSSRSVFVLIKEGVVTIIGDCNERRQASIVVCKDVRAEFAVGMRVQFSFAMSPIGLVASFSMFIQVVFLHGSFFQVVLIVVSVRSIADRGDVCSVLHYVLRAVSTVLQIAAFVVSPLPISEFVDDGCGFDVVTKRRRFTRERVQIGFSVATFYVIVGVVGT